MKNTTATSIKDFRDIVLRYFMLHARDMPWRHPGKKGHYDPYKILVSEIMLQQTQVVRVMPKYESFIKLFPDVKSLANAELGSVLKAWSGLGYNRRAKFLWAAARDIMTLHHGLVPETQEELTKLSGIGTNTAAAVIAYAYNKPVVFVETNIRTVIIHHFFNDQSDVSDKVILEIVANTLPDNNFREWYYALMDYGSFLKASVGNKSRQARIYAKQSTFKGSSREIRGQVLRILAQKPQTMTELKAEITDNRLLAICEKLESDGLIHKNKGTYSLG